MQTDQVEKSVEWADDSWRMHLLMLVVAFCVIGTMSYTLWKGSDIANRYTSQIDAAMTARLEMSLAHLWFEEVLAGDETVTIDQAERHLDEARCCAQCLLDGGQTWEGTIVPLKDRDLRVKAGEVAKGLAGLQALMERRYASVPAAAVGSQVDQDFDGAFGAVLNEAATIESSLRGALRKELVVYRAVLAVMILGTVTMAVYVAVVVRGACNRRARMVVTLGDLNQELQREIAERAAAEQQIAQQNTFLNDVIESLCHPFYVVDPRNHRVVLANSAAKDKGLYHGATCYVATHERAEPCNGPEHPCLVEEVVRTGQPATVEHVHRSPDDGIEYVELHGFPITDESGNTDRVIVYSLDITERKQAERQQAELVGQLEDTNSELNDFAYAVSHDLKAPLRGISALSSWIAGDYRDRLDEEGKEQLDLLQCRVRRMQDLIDGILTYSRIGRTDQELMRIDLNEHVREAIDLLGVPEGIEVVVEGQLPEIVCNETRIGHIFQNLIGNAIKYMGRPDGRITIGCHEIDGFYEFSVVDNGPGIEAKHFDRIFKVFQTLSPRDECASTGIGLSLVKKSVETCGGRVWVESIVGQGSTFRFTLPVQVGEPADEPLLVSGAAG